MTPQLYTALRPVLLALLQERPEAPCDPLSGSRQHLHTTRKCTLKLGHNP